MKNDWRLSNQANYLYRVKISRQKFNPLLDGDHAHCEFCWAKFGDDNKSLKVGYCTQDRYRWICEDCCQDFKKQFEWIIE